MDLDLPSFDECIKLIKAATKAMVFLNRCMNDPEELSQVPGPEMLAETVQLLRAGLDVATGMRVLKDPRFIALQNEKQKRLLDTLELTRSTNEEDQRTWECLMSSGELTQSRMNEAAKKAEKYFGMPLEEFAAGMAGIDAKGVLDWIRMRVSASTAQESATFEALVAAAERDAMTISRRHDVLQKLFEAGATGGEQETVDVSRRGDEVVNRQDEMLVS